ncbi:MAG TPA: VanW family protein [Methylomusa anaerophila]|uniref:VanW family protein n=1 Tax=Methylomusa anaerophila TaxID=1930071 RepID=UPI001E524157|nr:VanW family protein [Methylomusa anaerophila]HML87082.1 VanW family protein [Methylomusa anaerophila]
MNIILLFSSVSVLAASTAFLVTDEIYQGVTVGDINVGGLSVQQAEQKILAFFKVKFERPYIQVIFQDNVRSISAQDIDLNIDAAKLAKEAYLVGRTGSTFTRFKERYLSINQGHQLQLALTYNQDKLYSIFRTIARTVDREAKDAKLKVTGVGKTIEVVPEVVGYKVDLAKSMAEAAANLNTRPFLNLNLTVEEIVPAVCAKDLTEIDGLVSSYTTYFNPADQNRTQNILLAAKSVSDILVRAGEIFSFNNTVGLRLARHGYKEAPVYIDGKLVPDWGGGVCQVSSTLYNAILLADYDIEERTAHFRPPAYVPIGQDATVADNLLDFKFKNNSPHNIYITSEVMGNHLTINIYGKRITDPPQIQIIAADQKVVEPNTVIRQDSNLEYGKEIVEDEGEKGLCVTTYRIKKIDGKVVKQELLAIDEFPPVDRVVRMGTKIK